MFRFPYGHLCVCVFLKAIWVCSFLSKRREGEGERNHHADTMKSSADVYNINRWPSMFAHNLFISSNFDWISTNFCFHFVFPCPRLNFHFQWTLFFLSRSLSLPLAHFQSFRLKIHQCKWVSWCQFIKKTKLVSEQRAAKLNPDLAGYFVKRIA